MPSSPPSSVSRDRRERAGLVDLSFQRPPELLLEPRGHADERIEVDPRLDPLAVQEVDEVLRGDVPGGARRERAAADAADRRVEHRGARLEGDERVRIARAAGVVEVDADGHTELRPLRHEVPYLARHADADRVGEDDL